MTRDLGTSFVQDLDTRSGPDFAFSTTGDKCCLQTSVAKLATPSEQILAQVPHKRPVIRSDQDNERDPHFDNDFSLKLTHQQDAQAQSSPLLRCAARQTESHGFSDFRFFCVPFEPHITCLIPQILTVFFLRFRKAGSDVKHKTKFPKLS